MDKTRPNRSFPLPVPLIEAFDRWQSRTRVAKQDAAAVALFKLMLTDGTERDAMMAAMDAWLEAGGPLDDSGEIPRDFRPGTDAGDLVDAGLAGLKKSKAQRRAAKEQA